MTEGYWPRPLCPSTPVGLAMTSAKFSHEVERHIWRIKRTIRKIELTLVPTQSRTRPK